MPRTNQVPGVGSPPPRQLAKKSCSRPPRNVARMNVGTSNRMVVTFGQTTEEMSFGQSQESAGFSTPLLTSTPKPSAVGNFPTVSQKLAVKVSSMMALPRRPPPGSDSDEENSEPDLKVQLSPKKGETLSTVQETQDGSAAENGDDDDSDFRNENTPGPSTKQGHDEGHTAGQKTFNMRILGTEDGERHRKRKKRRFNMPVPARNQRYR